MAQGFSDIETAVCEMLEGIAPTVTRTPSTLPPQVILVRRIGGGCDDQGLQDIPIVEVTCIASETDTQTQPRGVAWQMAESCRQAIMSSVATVWANALIDHVHVVVGPVIHPDDNPKNRVITANYEFVLRRPFFGRAA
jgi:hypothetical protein